MLRIVRLTLRQLWHAPGYSVMVVLTLALAIGANSAVFSAVNAVLLRPLPVSDPARAVVVWQTDNQAGQAVIELTLRHLREWTANQSVFERAAVMGSHTWDAVLDDGRKEPVRLQFTGVSSGFFETLGVAPLLGRTLRAADDTPTSPPVLVLSYASWVRRFGADPNAIGRTLNLDGQPVEIVGIMPEGFDVPRGAEFWAPVMPVLAGGAASNATALSNIVNNVGVFYVVGRVRSTASAADVARQLDALDARLQRDVPGRPKWGDRAVVVPLLEYVFGPVRPALWALWAAVSVLLLIACANVSGLMLTRATLRRREQAVRLAIGATRSSIGRAWLIEILILAAAGGALGLVAAVYIGRTIVALAPDDLPGLQHITVSGTVAVFTLAIVAAAAILAGVLPIRQLSTVSLSEAFGSGERTTANRGSIRARSGLLVLQVALSVVLLVAAGLVVRSFMNLSRLDLGFQPQSVLSLSVQPRSIQGPANAWFDQLLTRVRALPGVEAAGAVYLRPLQLGPIGQGVRIWLEGQAETDAVAAANPTLNYQMATPGYFEAMRIPVVRGRTFTSADRAGVDRVAVVSESTARGLWPGQDPIGRRVLMSSFTPGVPRSWRTIVGVVKDVRYRGINEVQMDIYDPALQVARAASSLAIRTTGSPLGMIASVQAQVRALDPTAVVDNVVTMDAVVNRAVAPWRLSMWMFLLFASVAFGLALTGLVSVVALDVAHRRQEFAIRLALGASRRAILRAAIGRTVFRVAAGVAVGTLAAVLGTRLLRSLLFDVTPSDSQTFVVVVTLVALATTVAAYIPGRRAARAEVNTLLRHF
jgi:putative ABC transport system permease protein